MTTAAASEALHFEAPPINEVVFGLMFEPLRELLVPYLGPLWERYKPDYGTCKEQPPLAIQIEKPEGTATEIEGLEIPPLPRIWFEETEGNGLIQVQRDRFHYNWRRTGPEDEYPHFEKVLGLFEEKFEIFKNFMREIRPEELVSKQYELTYVNHIPLGEGWNVITDIGEVFSDFVWRRDEARMQPEAMTCRVAFPLQGGEGRLHATIRSASRISDAKKILLFDLTARGIGEDRSAKGMEGWFVKAHNQIVRAFVELTNPRVQHEMWRQQS